jgi:hypothetical protein
LIFLDVDGVLNVGICDPGNAPIEFSTKNLERASAVWDRRDEFPLSVQHCLERIFATRDHEIGGGENATYEKFVCSDKGWSDLLVGRLAKLITAAGEGCSVVLSSTWRLPQHTARARQLEEAIGSHLGRPFAFDARTDLVEDRAAEGRLSCIGDFAAEHCRMQRGSAGKLKILVLEDFHISPLGGWSCEGESIRCPEDVERYLVSRIPADVKATVKLIHTFDQWRAGGDLHVRVGAGIGIEHFYDALTFLDAPAQAREEPAKHVRHISAPAGRRTSARAAAATRPSVVAPF